MNGDLIRECNNVLQWSSLSEKRFVYTHSQGVSPPVPGIPVAGTSFFVRGESTIVSKVLHRKCCSFHFRTPEIVSLQAISWLFQETSYSDALDSVYLLWEIKCQKVETDLGYQRIFFSIRIIKNGQHLI